MYHDLVIWRLFIQTPVGRSKAQRLIDLHAYADLLAAGF